MSSQLISIKSTKITCVKTSSINPELNKNYYSFVVTFKKLNRPDHVLKSVHELSTSFLCGNTEKENNLLILINSGRLMHIKKINNKINQRNRTIN